MDKIRQQEVRARISRGAVALALLLTLTGSVLQVVAALESKGSPAKVLVWRETPDDDPEPGFG